MTINPLIPGSINALRDGSRFRESRLILNDLQRQMATGKLADTFGGLGSGRGLSLDVRAKLSAIAGFKTTIQNAETRLSFMNLSLQQLAKNASEAKADIPPVTNFALGADGRTSGQLVAEDRLKQSIDQLNAELNGRYLFSGRSSDVKPVVDYDLMMNGDGVRAGLKQMIVERKAADLGTDGMGRLTLGVAGTTVTLSDVAALPYGFDVGGASSNSANITATYNAGPPGVASFDVTAQPTDGQTVSVRLDLPDGTSETITLTARATPDPASTEDFFQIGASPAATAANLEAALRVSVERKAQTALSASSAQVAATDFFNGSTTNPPLRVPGPPFDTAVAAPAPGTATDTVIWYQGDDQAASARQTAPVRIDDTHSVGIGAQANEQGIRSVLTQFAVLAAETFSETSTTDRERFDELGSRVRSNLSTPPAAQGVEYIVVEFANASVAINAAKERQNAREAMLTTTLDGVENAQIEEVAARILAMQTRLEASYQVTSILSRLSLTNFL